MVQSVLARVGGWKPIAVIAAGVLLVVGGVVVVAQARGKDAGREALADASRVLQAVNVKVAPNGDLTGVKGNVVGTTTQGKQFSFSDDYAPDSSAKDLPVRVLTSYRTDKKSGSDLSDLDGYTGRVDITMTVQNTTVQPQKLTYDVDGAQRTQSALVGVPLTVVAATALPDTKPSAVVTKGDKSDAITNGVLSQDQKGNTQVQWATILAPPQLDASTTMTLSVNAKDFHVPDFDLSVQPGVVTDPSMQALLDTAFNPNGSEEMKLQQRTIALIAELNAVLAKAGKSMADVRKTLNDSSKDLGDKTVGDLQQSTESIAASVKSLKGSVNQLGGDITTSLKGTESQTLSELNGLVSSVNGLLGDTNAQMPAVKVTPNPDPSVKCDVTVDVAKGTPSIYGNLLSVVALLNGYAQANDLCKVDVQTVLMNVIGPSYDQLVADKDICKDPRYDISATCALQATQDSLEVYAKNLETSRDQAVSVLTGLGTDAFVKAVNGTPDGNGVPQGGLKQAADDLKAKALAAGGKPDVTGLQTAMDSANTAYNNMGTAISGMHQAALNGQSQAGDLVATNQALAKEICDGKQSGSIDAAEADKLSQFTSNTDCSGNAVGTTPAGGTPMEKQLADQKAAWDGLVTATDVAGSGAALPDAFRTLRTALDNMQAEITKFATATGDPAVLQAAAVLDGKVSDVVGRATTIGNSVGTESPNGDTGAIKDIKKAFNDAIAGLRNTQTGDPSVYETQVRQVYQRGLNNSAALGLLFDKSSKNLTDAGAKIQADGKATIDQSKGAFAAQEKESAGRISAAIAKGLKQVDAGVGSSTKDMDAAQTLLLNDLRNVLLDLGTRKVKGSGLLGAMATSAATTGSANYQVALASRTATAYSNVRQSDIVGLLLRQAQTDASQQMQSDLPAFRLDLPSSADHTTVYTFHLDSAG